MDRRGFTGLSLASLAWPLISRPAAAQVPAPSADEIAAKVASAYASFHAYRARFTQRFGSYPKASHAKGSVVFQRPGLADWSYDRGNRVVSDGQTTRVYEHESKQMFVLAASRTHYAAALSFLQGPGSFSHSTVSFPAQSPLRFKGGHVLRLVPVQSTTAYKHLIWYVDAQTSHVRRVLLIDHRGNRNRFDFERPVQNPKLKRGTFAFTPPAGTRIIEAP